MPTNETPPTLVSRCGDPVRTVVWLSGEHDIASRVHLSGTLARAAGLDDADIVIDLSGVTFMDASTVSALLEARNHLRVGSRSLFVRDPSPRARRVLDVCGLTHLIDEHAASEPPHVATALGSWIDVPTMDRGRGPATPPSARGASSEEPVRVAARRCIEPTETVRYRRAPS